VIGSFRDKWLETFYVDGVMHREIPADLYKALFRKLEIIRYAASESDLRVPPDNRFEHLADKLKGKCAIRVNKQYRLIFEWDGEKADKLYLDPHSYQ
jgi:proteic killer suppression protein